jgi:nucleoside-diphosphate-sugar epimerase
MKALVTGATGFIGSHLVEELLKKGYRVACLIRKESTLKWIESLDVTLIYGDCRNKESLLDAVKDVDTIFHIAGLTKAPKDEDFFAVNVKGTENLLEAALAKNPNLKRFLYLSSLAAVGPSSNGNPVNENTPPRPVSSYGKSKLEGEYAVMKYKDKIPVTIIRPPAVYGPRDKDLYVFYRILKKGIFPYWGKCYYSLLYVDDLVRGIIMAAESENAEGGVFFLSDENIYTNEDIASVISEAVGTKPIRVRIPQRIFPLIAHISSSLSKQSSIINKDKVKELSYPKWICDSSKANKKLGFSPRVKMSEGIKWTANWYRIHQWL